jgi:hypothetical protein
MLFTLWVIFVLEHVRTTLNYSSLTATVYTRDCQKRWLYEPTGIGALLDKAYPTD